MNRPEGWLAEQEGRALQEIVKSLPGNAIIIEVGTWCGLSTSYMSEVLSNDQVIITVDNYLENSQASQHTTTKPREAQLRFIDFFFKERLFTKKIFPIYGSSLEIASLFKNSNQKIDFLFIDGDHNYNNVKEDYTLWSEFNPSYVAFHDYIWEGVAKLVNEIKTNYKDFKTIESTAILEK